MNFLNEVINQASKKIGNQKELENYLGLAKGYLTEIKAEKRGLPEFAQIKLETYMGLDKGALRPASAIITEKNPERKTFWNNLIKIEAKAWKIANTPVFKTKENKKSNVDQ